MNLALALAPHSLGTSFLPHGAYQLQPILFALQFKLGFPECDALRVTQVGIAMLGTLLMIAAALRPCRSPSRAVRSLGNGV